MTCLVLQVVFFFKIPFFKNSPPEGLLRVEAYEQPVNEQSVNEQLVNEQLVNEQLVNE